MSATTQSRMAKGAAWMVLFKFVERSLGVISTLVLARVLSPKDFGLVAMATSFIAMAELLTNFGFDVALIQNQGATVRQYHAAWTCNILFGLSIFLLMLACAAPITMFYSEPALFWVVCCLALGPLIGGCENIGVVAFRKELRFRSEFAFQITRKLAGFLVTIPLAIWLRSYWALVAGVLASRSAGTIISYVAHPFRPRFCVAGAGSLFSFSKWLLLNNGLGFLKTRLTDFAIGRLHGAASLGRYNVGFELANLPTSELGAPINRALVPGFAKIGQERAALQSAYSNAVGLIALLGLPAAAGIFAVSDLLVPVVLGPQWLPVVRITQVLGIFGAIELFHSSMCAVLIGTGHPGAVAKAHVVLILIVAILLIVLVGPFGASGAAVAMLAASILSTPAYLAAIRKHAGIGAAVFARAIARPSVSATAMAFCVRAVMPRYVTSMPTREAALLLLGGVLLGLLIYSALVALLWAAAGRPPGPERVVLDRVISALASKVPTLRPKWLDN